MMGCHRLIGGSVRDCGCRLPMEAGWGPCPPEARGILRRPVPRRPSGDVCHDCGGVTMIRTGTCLTCASCGSSSGGCS